MKGWRKFHMNISESQTRGETREKVKCEDLKNECTISGIFLILRYIGRVENSLNIQSCTQKNLLIWLWSWKTNVEPEENKTNLNAHKGGRNVPETLVSVHKALHHLPATLDWIKLLAIQPYIFSYAQLPSPTITRRLHLMHELFSFRNLQIYISDG